MPVCKKCGNAFSNRARINGQIKNLHSRKFCIICSPFGSGNRIDLTKKDITVNEQERYKQKLALSAERVKKRKKMLMQMAITYKGGKCIICGYNKCSRALEFHHLEPEYKEFAISNEGMSKSWESLKKELNKTVLLCAVCHREVHDGMTKIEFIPQQSVDVVIENKRHCQVYHCKECSVQIGRTRTGLCIECYKKSIRKVERPPFDVLIEDLKHNTYVAVGKKYGVTDNSIKHWMKSYKKQQNKSIQKE